MKRALIVKLGAIGDVVMAIPAANQLHLAGYAIDWIAGPATAPLLRCYPWINVIVADDRAVLKGSLPERIRAIIAVWRSIAWTYDLVATLYYDARWRIFALPVRAGRHVRLSRTDRASRILPTRHHSDEFARILLALPDECRDTSLSPLPLVNLPPSPIPATPTPRLALVPGGASNLVSQQTLRRWPVDRYAAIARRALDAGWEVVLLGGPGDEWVRDAFASLSNHARLRDTIAALAIPEVVSVANTCSVVLTHDTGPLHLAGLSSARVVALFGPTDPGSFAPRRDGVQVLWGGANFACRPCYDGRNFAPCPSNGCMQSIAVDDVWTAVNQQMNAAAQGAS